MGNLVNKIISLKAKEFNKKRELLAPENSYCWLLEKVGMSGDYVNTFILEDWFYKFNDFRDKMHVYVGTIDPTFVSALNQATDCSINGIVYEIDKRDKNQPDGQKAWWEFYCSMTLDTFNQDNYIESIEKFEVPIFPGEFYPL